MPVGSVSREVLPAHLQTGPIPFLIELRNYVLQGALDFVSYIVQNAKGYYDAAVEAEGVVNILKQEGKSGWCSLTAWTKCSTRMSAGR